VHPRVFSIIRPNTGGLSTIVNVSTIFSFASFSVHCPTMCVLEHVMLEVL
jgi:hypothetical protein